MKAEDYRKTRILKGYTQPELARLLGLHWTIISKRERGVVAIGAEAAAAIGSLPPKGDPELLRKTAEAVARGDDLSKLMNTLNPAPRGSHGAKAKRAVPKGNPDTPIRRQKKK
jgi:transcriptional regulator with XRE-family HTH domain